MIHERYQSLIASKKYDEVYKIGREDEENYPFISLAYGMYLDLMLGSLKDANNKLKQLTDLYLLDKLELGIRDTLEAYYYFRTGSLNEANKALAVSAKYFESQNREEIGFWIQIRYVIEGGITTRSGNYEDSTKFFKEALKLALELNIGNQIIQGYNNYGYSNLLLGKLNEAKREFKAALKAIEIHSLHEFTYYPLSNLGIFYFLKGDLQNAELHHSQALEIARQNKNDVQIASQYRDLGLIERMRGNYEQSLEYLQKALQLHIQIGNDIWTSSTLIHIIELSQVLNHASLAEAYFGHLTSLAQDTQNKLIESLHLFGKALILKNKSKIKDKVIAIELLQKLSDNQHLDRDTRMRVMLYHSELLLTEYRMTGSNEIVNELNEIISEFSKFSEENHSTTMYVEALCLQAQIYLLEKEYEKGFNLFIQAIKITRENELNYLSNRIEERMSKFREHSFIFQNALNSESFRKKFLEGYLSDYIHEVLQLKKEFKEE